MSRVRDFAGRHAGRIGLFVLVLFAASLALIGILTITKGTPINSVQTLDGDALPAVDDPLFARSMELYSGTRLTPQNRVELLLNGDGTYPVLWSDLRSATKTITAQLYYSQPGAVADTMAAVLRERAGAGVRVLLLLDAFGSGPLEDDYIDTLRASGVNVAWLRPLTWYALDKASKRSHVRSIVVDGRVGYTGGFGLADYWLGNGRDAGEWRETNVRFWGPAVGQLQAAFADGWAEATGELITGDAFFPPCSYAVVCTEDGAAVRITELAAPEDLERHREDRREARAGEGIAPAAEAPPADSARALGANAPDTQRPPVVETAPAYVAEAGLMHAVPSFGSTTAERLLALSISAAKRTLYISNSYFVPDDDFREMLTRAVQRGVDVRILTVGDSTDIKTTLYAGRARYEELLNGGVRIYEYQPTMMHAKTFVVDGIWASVGSMNFDNRSLALNNESNLIVSDPTFGAKMNAIFLEDLEYAEEILIDAHRQRPWLDRVKEWGANLFSRVL